MAEKFLFKAMLITMFAGMTLTPAGCSSKQTCTKEQTMGKKPKETAKQENTLPKVKLETSMGNIVIEIDEKAAPVTVKNFLGYVQKGFYNGTIFHRVIPNFMIQGGGFTADMQQKQAGEPIINEANNGLKNERGTIAMARTNNPNSATCQFFINLKGNDFLNYAGQGNLGYAVFGKVVEGMDVVDKIAGAKTGNKFQHSNVPVEAVIIKTASVM